jgi:hypothetical protein
MMNPARHWFRPSLFLLLSLVAVPACEYGQGQDGGGRYAYRMSVTVPADSANSADTANASLPADLA